MNKKNSLVNLGCRLNIYEGEIIKNHLNNNNIKNITVINSCAVTAEAEKKVTYEIRKAKRINPKNKIIQNINNDFSDNNLKLKTDDIIKTLFDLACVIEDETIKDTKDFSRRIQNLMS